MVCTIAIAGIYIDSDTKASANNSSVEGERVLADSGRKDENNEQFA